MRIVIGGIVPIVIAYSAQLPAGTFARSSASGIGGPCPGDCANATVGPPTHRTNANARPRRDDMDAPFEVRGVYQTMRAAPCGGGPRGGGLRLPARYALRACGRNPRANTPSPPAMRPNITIVPHRLVGRK